MRRHTVRSTARTTTAIVVSLVVVLAVLLSGSPASAHDGSDADMNAASTAAEDRQHALDDLAGVPMRQIERSTAARADELGLPDHPARAPRADPAVRGTLGEWSPVIDTRVVPVFTAVLPDGTVLMWDSVGDKGVDAYPGVQTYTRAAVWDPATNTSKDVRLNGYNIFCAGFVQLPNGDVLIAGGNESDQQEGIVQTHLFHWRTSTWTRGPDMAGERWYPSLAALGDGSALIVAGGPDRAEVYTPDAGAGRLRTLVGFDSFALRQYPFLVPRPDGQVEVVGPEWQLHRYSTQGNGYSTDTGPRELEYLNRNYGSFAPYLPDKVLVAGGGTADDPDKVTSSDTAVIADLGQGGTTPTSFTGRMASGRRQQSLTVLADGSVAVTGGMNSSTQVEVDLDAAVKTAERWDPATGRWTTLAAASRVREYHSSALLLPDGRVMTGGGGICGRCVSQGYLEKNVEYYSPPYLFDGNGQPAVRPALSGVPAQVDNGGAFTFASSSAPDIAKVALVRLGASTHSIDQGQRYVPLSFERSGSTITATGPKDGNQAPPGYYLMFAITSAGVPSMGARVHVGAPGAPTPATPTPTPTPTPAPTPAPTPTQAPTSTPGEAVPNDPAMSPAPIPTVDVGPVLGPPLPSPPARCFEAATSSIRSSPVVRWTCSDSPNQTWKRGPQQSLRVLGRCLSFGRDAAVGAGARVLLERCDGERRQRVGLVGRTIRPVGARDLCVTSAGTSLDAGRRMALRTCDGGKPQRWRL